VYLTGLRSAVNAAGLPYGYTVTMWSSGQLLIHFKGAPGVGFVGLFATGALIGYSVLRLVTRSTSDTMEVGLGASPGWLRPGATQALAVAATLGTVAAAGWLLCPALSWIVGGMATVLGYLGVMGFEYALQGRAARGSQPKSANGHGAVT